MMYWFRIPRHNTPLMNVALWLLAVIAIFHIVAPEGRYVVSNPEVTAATVELTPAPVKPIAASVQPAVKPPEAEPATHTNEADDAANRPEDPNDPYHHIILAASKEYSVDPAIVKAIIMAESSYNPKAVSRRGAMGLMQLMPRTAAAMGVKDIFDPEHNIHGGVRYYKRLLNRYDGNVELALAAYNAGPKKVRKYRGIPPFKATRYYIRKVIKFYHIYKKEMESEQT